MKEIQILMKQLRPTLWAALLCLLSLAWAQSALADAVGPDPTNCPAGSEGSSCHGGPYCSPARTCTDSSTCEEGQECLEIGLCIGRIDCTSGWTPPDAGPYYSETVEDICTADGQCSEGTCDTRSVCMRPNRSLEGGCACSSTSEIPRSTLPILCFLGVFWFVGRNSRKRRS